MRTPQLLASGSASINMTPMIDVVFLLIIFFLVSSHLAQQENSLELDLPQADSGLEDLALRETMIVNVSADGRWQLAGAVVDEANLTQRFLARVASASEPLQLKIRTDREVPYKRIEPLLRMAAAAGIGDIVFSVYERSDNVDSRSGGG
ncbi:MAG: biopolymer transporter ExbD [Planctomycetales bacterium]|nr:biopolymer transporter ExbD [Planctomycetales bacterium]